MISRMAAQSEIIGPEITRTVVLFGLLQFALSVFHLIMLGFIEMFWERFVHSHIE